MFVTKVLALTPPEEIDGLSGAEVADSDSVIQNVVIPVITYVLDFVTIIGVIYVIWAGIRLITSGGEDEAKDAAKKTILYVIIGIIVVLCARLIVGFFAEGGGILEVGSST